MGQSSYPRLTQPKTSITICFSADHILPGMVILGLPNVRSNGDSRAQEGKVVFSPTRFPFAFLPFAVIVAYPLRRAWQNAALLVFSIFFYVWGAGAYACGL